MVVRISPTDAFRGLEWTKIGLHNLVPFFVLGVGELKWKKAGGSQRGLHLCDLYGLGITLVHWQSASVVRSVVAGEAAGLSKQMSVFGKGGNRWV